MKLTNLLRNRKGQISILTIVGIAVVMVVALTVIPMINITNIDTATSFLTDRGYRVVAASGDDFGDVIPAIDNTYVLGRADRQWKELHVAGASIYLGTLTLTDDDGCLTTSEFHAHGAGGVAGYLKMGFGTAPTHNEAGHAILWVDSSENLQFQKADGTDLEVVRLNSSGHLDVGTANLIVDTNTLFVDSTGDKVGINTTDPKRQFDFDGANVRTQRYTDSDTNTNLGYGSFGTGNLTGSHNNAFGNLSLYSITSGVGNLGLGNEALTSLTSGSNNVGIASYAGKAIVDGSHNISIGYKSGYIISSGDNNISIGSYSNYTNALGSNNIVIGYDIDAPSTTGNNQLNIGNTIYGDLSVGNVGIGTASPNAKLEVNGYTMLGNDAPSIKVKYFTGTTDADNSTAFNHNITNASTKIILVEALIYNSAQSAYIAPNDNGNWTYQLFHGTTLIQLVNVGTDMRSQTYKVLIIYQE